jgi:large subunit ribosomal protein L29
MNTKDIRELKVEDLREQIKKTEAELTDLHVELAAHELKDVSKISKTRKSIARLKTILNEKEGETGVGAK